MKKMTYSQLEATFLKRNADLGITTQFSDKFPVHGIIVFKNESWPHRERDFNLTERSYRVQSDNKGFISGLGGSSVFGDCLDGIDEMIRLDLYMREGGWKVDYCYIEEFKDEEE